jgi:dTDP-4-amino-4,6-dideoxygalactose transaminase
MKIELIDLRQRYKEESSQILKCINKVAAKGNLVLTEELNNFENNICNYTGLKYCLGLNSGTDALMIALWALGIGKGDEVITSPTSFVATIGAIIHVGAKPVFVDVADDLNIDPLKIEEKITKKTKAIMPVHWAGRMCDMNQISKIAKKYKLKIIEDAAQGMGSFFNNKHAGSFSDIAAFSTHPLKNLNGLGDGGFITTNNKLLYNKIKLYRNHGMKSRDNVHIFGVNSRLDVLNAEVLNFRLKKLKSVILKRRRNIAIYQKYLNPAYIKVPFDSKNQFSSFVIFLCLCEKRDALQSYLNKKGIQSLIYYGTPLHKHVASKKMGLDKIKLPVAENLAKKVLALPHHQGLKEKDIKFVCREVNKFYKKF